MIYDQKDMRTKLVRDALAAHGEKVTELDGVVARGGLLPSYAVSYTHLDVYKRQRWYSSPAKY